MYIRLVPLLLIWPEHEELRMTLPLVFRNAKLRNCVCIIDCFEIFIEKTGIILASTQTYSPYKSHNIMTLLGLISFISNGWWSP